PDAQARTFQFARLCFAARFEGRVKRQARAVGCVEGRGSRGDRALCASQGVRDRQRVAVGRVELEGGAVDGHVDLFELRRYALHEGRTDQRDRRSEEHTSELQSRGHLVCRLLLEKKKKKT